jgi:hypothetical protein
MRIFQLRGVIMNQSTQHEDEKKAQRIAEKKEYLDKVIGVPDSTLIDTDSIKQKSLIEKEEERLAKLVIEQGVSAAVTNDCNALLSEVNALVNAEKIDTCTILGKFNKIKQRLVRAYESRQAAPVFSQLIFILNFVYLFIFVWYIVTLSLVPGQKNLENTAFVCLACAIWGGIGGVVDAFFAFYKHISSQDFDRQYWPWYCFHPLLGLSLGAVIFLVFQAGWLAVGGTGIQNAVSGNITSDTTTVVSTGAIGATALPIAVAFLAGFRQQTAVDFITRIISSIFQKNDDTNKQK